MPYIIYIPRPYQSRTHLITPSYTTTATSISISTASPLATAIYNDAIAWGWHVEVNEIKPPEWKTYVKIARRMGWFEDLFRIWQREHGIRILARNRARQSSPPTTSQAIFRELRDFANWVKRRTMWPESTDWEERAKMYAKGRTEQAPGVLKRRASENDVRYLATVSVISLPGSMAERLEKCEERRRSGLYEQEAAAFEVYEADVLEVEGRLA